MKKNQDSQVTLVGKNKLSQPDIYHDRKLSACLSIDNRDEIANRTYRDETVGWMLSVGQFFRLKDVTIQNSIILFDKILSNPKWIINVDETECVVFSLLFISIKLFQEYFITIHEFIDRANIQLSSLSVLTMEIQLMKILNDNVTPYLPSEYYFEKHRERVSGQHLLKLLVKSDFKKYRQTELMDGLHCWLKLGKNTAARDLPKDKVALIKSLDLYFIQSVSTSIRTK